MRLFPLVNRHSPSVHCVSLTARIPLPGRHVGKLWLTALALTALVLSASAQVTIQIVNDSGLPDTNIFIKVPENNQAVLRKTRGEKYADVRMWEKAEADLAEAVRLDAKANVGLRLAIAYLETGKPQAALDEVARYGKLPRGTVMYMVADPEVFVVKVKAYLALKQIEKAEAAVAPVQDVRDVMTDPQYAALDTVTTVDDPELGPLRMQNVLFRLSATPGAIRWAGRPHGADTDAVLTELGLTPADLDGLREEGVL